MTTERWGPLLEAQAEGAFEEIGSGASRRVVFADGTCWFPEGHESGSTGNPGLIFSALLFMGSLVGTIVGLADGAVWGWACAAGLLLSAVLIYVLSGAENRKEAQLLRRLAVGVFLFSDSMIIRKQGHDRAIARTDITAINVRSSFRHGSASVSRLEIETNDDRVPTDLIESDRPVLDAWLQSR